MSGADKDYIPMFSWTNLFLAVLMLNNKVIFNPTIGIANRIDGLERFGNSLE